MSGLDHDAVLFDLDGVLIDSRLPFAHGINGALASNGLPERPEDELHQYLGPPIHETFRALVPDEALVQPCVDAYRERYRALAAAETTVFPGITALLRELSATTPLVIATSKPRALAEPLTRSLELDRFFAGVVGPELTSEDERKAVTIERALLALPPGAHPVMVGDRKYDVIAAHAHGIPAIGVLWGIGSEDELRSAGADALVRTPAELGALLAQAPRAAS